VRRARAGTLRLFPPLPLAEPAPALPGDKFNSIIFLVAPFQLALLNPLAFAMLESGAELSPAANANREPQPDTREAAGAGGGLGAPLAWRGGVRFRCAPESCGAAAGGGAASGPATRPADAPTPTPTPTPTLRRRGLGFTRTLGKVARSPLVLSVLLGGGLRLCLLAGGDPKLPPVLTGILLPLKQAFTATALVTLGLSLRTRLSPLTQKPLSTVGLLCAKVFALPLLTRVLAELFGVTDSDGRNFAFLYGMLPAAPTVVVFAREYSQRANAEYLASVQFVGLLLAVRTRAGPNPLPSPRRARLNSATIVLPTVLAFPVLVLGQMLNIYAGGNWPGIRNPALPLQLTKPRQRAPSGRWA